MFAKCSNQECSLFEDLQYLIDAKVASTAEYWQPFLQEFPWFMPLIAAILGALFASFSGVVADRLPRQLGINRPKEKGISISFPPSHCDHCKKRIGVIALIPVIGWIATMGKCQCCKKKIPAKYPIIEAASAIASFYIILIMGANGAAIATCLCMWTLIAISWLDWTSHEIPDFFTAPLFFAGLLFSPFEPEITSRVVGALTSAVFLLAIFKAFSMTKEVDAMSYGDVTLAGALGAWLGLNMIFIFLIITPILYIAYAAPMRAKGIIWTPMGPGLSAGFMITALLGYGL